MLAVLEAFVYDPLINWRLVTANKGLSGAFVSLRVSRHIQPKSMMPSPFLTSQTTSWPPLVGRAPHPMSLGQPEQRRAFPVRHLAVPMQWQLAELLWAALAVPRA